MWLHLLLLLSLFIHSFKSPQEKNTFCTNCEKENIYNKIQGVNQVLYSSASKKLLSDGLHVGAQGPWFLVVFKVKQ